MIARTLLVLLLTLAPVLALAQPHVGAPMNGATGGSSSTGRAILPGSAKNTSSPSVVLDTMPVFGAAPNDRYDANGSNYTTGAPAPDSTDDFVRVDETPCASTSCKMTFTATSTGFLNTLNLPDDFRYLLCRASGSPFAPCKGSGCVSTLAATSGERGFPIVVYDASEQAYFSYAVTAATTANCNSTGSFPVTVSPAIHDNLTTSDQVQPFYEDVIHYSEFGARILATYAVLSTHETTRIPRAGDMPGVASGTGSMETDCATTWTKTGAGTLAQTTPGTTEYSNLSLRSAMWGKGCALSGGAAGNYIQSPAMTTVAGRTYWVRFYARVPATAFASISFSVTNATSLYDFTWNLGSSGVGWTAVANAPTAGCQNFGYAGAWQLCVAKFQATSTSSQIRIGPGGSYTVWVDEVFAAEADLPTTSKMLPLFSAGPSSITLDGDSQFEAASPIFNGYGRFAAAFEWAFGRFRSRVNVLHTHTLTGSLVCSVRKGSRGHSGTGISDVTQEVTDAGVLAIYGQHRFRTQRPAYAIFNHGINDLKSGPAWGGTAPSTPDTAEAEAAIVGAMNVVGSYSDLPIWLTPQPWAYATGTTTTVCGGYYCSVMQNAIVSAVLHGGRVSW
mgnify:CR=1 FL=1